MNTLHLSDWIAVLIDARLFGLTKQEAIAQAALKSQGINIEFATDLTA